MIACVILNYNDSETTIKLVEEIEKFKRIDTIIIVDNCSQDDSLEKLSKLASEKVVIISAENNLGYAAGNNIGIKYAISHCDCDVLIICNPDVLFKESTVEKLCKFISDHDMVGAVTCKMKCLSGIDLPIAWRLPLFKDCILENLIILKRIIGETIRYNDKHLSSSRFCEVDAVPGSFFCISKKAIVDVGFFDENTFLYYEENILASKLKEKKYHNYIMTEDEYIHNHSVSINKSIKSIRQRLLIASRSRLYYCKNYLKIKKWQEILFNITAVVGIVDYLLLKSIINRVNKK